MKHAIAILVLPSSPQRRNRYVGAWRNGRVVRFGALAMSFMLVACLSGCVAENVARMDSFTGLLTANQVLLMPPDIKYYRLTASGIT